MTTPPPTPKSRVYLFDTTLRDGAQTTGIDFSLHDKTIVAGMLDRLSVDYIEGGYPGANPVDTAFFDAPPKTSAKFIGFGMTKRAGVSASNDPGLTGLLAAKADGICFVAKSWDYHVDVALGCTLVTNNTREFARIGGLALENWAEPLLHEPLAPYLSTT